MNNDEFLISKRSINKTHGGMWKVTDGSAIKVKHPLMLVLERLKRN